MDAACNCTVYTEVPTLVTSITADHLSLMRQTASAAREASTRGRFGRDLEPPVKVQPSWDVYEASRSDDCGLGWLALAAVVAMIATAIAVAVAGAALADWVLG